MLVGPLCGSSDLGCEEQLQWRLEGTWGQRMYESLHLMDARRLTRSSSCACSRRRSSKPLPMHLLLAPTAACSSLSSLSKSIHLLLYSSLHTKTTLQYGWMMIFDCLVCLSSSVYDLLLSDRGHFLSGWRGRCGAAPKGRHPRRTDEEHTHPK